MVGWRNSQPATPFMATRNNEKADAEARARFARALKAQALKRLPSNARLAVAAVEDPKKFALNQAVQQLPLEARLALRAAQDPKQFLIDQTLAQLTPELRTAYKILKTKDPVRAGVGVALRTSVPQVVMIERIPFAGEYATQYVFDPLVNGVTNIINKIGTAFETEERTAESVFLEQSTEKARLARAEWERMTAPAPLTVSGTVETYDDGYYDSAWDESDRLPPDPLVPVLTVAIARSFRTPISYDGFTNELFVNQRTADMAAVRRMLAIQPQPKVIYYE